MNDSKDLLSVVGVGESPPGVGCIGPYMSFAKATARKISCSESMADGNNFNDFPENVPTKEITT